MTEREKQLLEVIQVLRMELHDCIDFMETFDAEYLAGDAEEGEQRLEDKHQAVEKTKSVLTELGLDGDYYEEYSI